MEDTERLIRHGRHLFKTATDLGWTEEEAEGPMEWILRRAREIAMCDALDNHWHLEWVRQQREKGLIK